MHQVKTFRAASMQEALAIVRRELGADAVILNTRQVSQKRLIPFLPKREHVEVTAGTGINVRSVQTPAARPRAEAVASDAGIDLLAQRPATSPQTPRPTAPVAPQTPLEKAALLAAEVEKRNALKAEIQQRLGGPVGGASSPQSLAPGPIPPAFNRPQESIRPATTTPAPSSPHETRSVGDPSARHTAGPSQHVPHKADEHTGETHQASVPKPEPTGSGTLDEEPAAPPNQAAALAAAAAQMLQSSSAQNINSEVTSRLDTLQKMVENLTRSSHLRGGEEMPGELFDVYTGLIDADVEDDLARELIFSLRQHATQDQLHDADTCRTLLSGLVESEIRCSHPIKPANGRRKVVALVGPTGVGKTTTIAKLAANFRLRDGIRMGLVTVDTYRIAAVEQLRTYAEIIDLPMKVVTSPQEMRRALDELAGLDLVLIDTAGRSPRDELKIQELKSMLNEANVDEVHLVMSLTASVRSIRTTCDQFRPVEPTSLVLTKLDEANGMGSLLSVSRQVNLPFSYLTTGQDVPEDIEPASASRISRLVLGLDRVFN